MLYAYELGMLSDEDAQAVEHHLCHCDHCFKNAQEFKDFAELLRRSPFIRSEIRAEAKASSRTGVARFLLIAATVIALAIPVYRFVIRPDRPELVQSLDLAPLRNNSAAVLDLERGGTAEIHFVVEEPTTTGQYRITISQRDGTIVYSNSDFSGFNEFGQGTITVPVSTFDTGYYMLTVTDLSDAHTLSLAKYPFRVK